MDLQQERRGWERSLGSAGSFRKGSVDRDVHLISALCPIRSKPRGTRANRKDAPALGN